MSISRSAEPLKWISKLQLLDKRLENLENFKGSLMTTDADIDQMCSDVLREACQLLREAEAEQVHVLDSLVVKIDDFINRGVVYCQKNELMTKCFVDDKQECPVVLDDYMTLGRGTMDLFLEGVSIFTQSMPDSSVQRETFAASLPALPETWKPSMLPHPQTSRLARFRPNQPLLSNNASTPLANILYQARCEIKSKKEYVTSKLHVSSGGSIMAYSSAGGWKNRTPFLTYYALGETDPHNSGPRQVEWEVSLPKNVFYITTDESRKLLFAADHERVKSYRWGLADGRYRKIALPTHTLNANFHRGPLHVVENRSIWRAGVNSIAIWNIDDLETHGPQSKGIIEEKIEQWDTSRDEEDKFEPSSGSEPHTKVLYADKVNIGNWYPHPQIPGIMFCAAETREHDDYRCSAVNFDQGGKIVARYLSHGGRIASFSTSPGDSNLLVTACADSFTRVFDLRRPLPVMLLDGSRGDDPCSAALFIHPDGIPTIISGQETKERVMVWDIRARTLVHELSTGNNSVESLAWDSAHATLYASTSRRNEEYRKSEIPFAFRTRDQDKDIVDEGRQHENYRDGTKFRNATRWPKKAYHPEDYFGYAYDSGGDTILTYQFKEICNPEESPRSGSRM